jgi:hypothetical protein
VFVDVMNRGNIPEILSPHHRNYEEHEVGYLVEALNYRREPG